MILICVLFFTFKCSAAVMRENEYGKNCSETQFRMSFCPSGWEWKGQHCFFWSHYSDHEPKTWGKAEDYCRIYDAHLASVTTTDVYEYLMSKMSKDIWIGATNHTENGTWVWTDCSPFNSENPSQGNGSCAHLTTDGHGSNSKSCGEKIQFVCSKPLCPGNSGLVEQD